MMKFRIVALLPVLLAWSVILPAQDGVADAKIYFAVGSSVLDMSFKDNGRTLRRFVDRVNDMNADQDTNVRNITVETGSSPEGDPARNERLAQERARSLRSYLVKELDLDPSQIKAYSIGTDWGGMIELVNASDVLWKDDISQAVLNSDVIISNTIENSRTCQKLLKDIDGGKAWEWLKESVFPEMRAGSGTLKCYAFSSSDSRKQRDTVVIVHRYDGPDPEWYLKAASEKAYKASVSEVLTTLEKKPRRFRSDTLYRAPKFVLRTNLLFPLLNSGVEVPVGNRWSVAADLYWPWMWRPLMNRLTEPYSSCFQVLAASVEGRYWLGVGHRNKPEYRKYRLTGHSIGISAVGGYYDFERNYNGMQGYAVAAGLDYMYTLPLGKGDVRLEFNVGFGVGYTEWEDYEVVPGTERLIGTEERGSWWGPVPMKAGVNLMVPIYGKRR